MSGSHLHWDPLTATVEVWVGESLDRLEFIANSLREVDIPSRSLTDDPQNLRVLVRPEDEASAREIVREILEGAAPARSIRLAEDEFWRDEPVRSWLFAWLPGVILLGLGILAFAVAPNTEQLSTLDPLLSVLGFIDKIGTLWMIYQAIRYEIRPLRFILLSLLFLSWVWYYFERYSRRIGRHRLPTAVRERIAPRPSV